MVQIQDYWPRHYKTDTNKFLTALKIAINNENADLESYVEYALDQLFSSTACGISLINLGDKKGFQIWMKSI